MRHWHRPDFENIGSRTRYTWILIAAGAITYYSISSYKKGQAEKKAKGEAELAARRNQEMMDKLLAGPEAPTPEDAKEKARLATEKQRRIRALAGGKTILSSSGPTLSSGAGKTLLGS